MINIPGSSELTGELKKIYNGFQSARALITANNYAIFDHLEKEKTVKGIAGKIGTDTRATEILLDALTGLGLLKKKNGRYRNAGIASRLLVSGRPSYQGDIIRHADSLWDKWSDLDSIVASGRPSETPGDHRSFILGMHNLSVLKAKHIIAEIGLHKGQKSLDLGGGPGTYAIEMAKKGGEVTLFDTPDTVRIARTVVRDSGVSRGKIVFKGGNFLNDDIGSGYDLILISQIIHMFSENVNMRLLRKCRKSLNKTGRLAVHDFIISKDRVRPGYSSLFSVNMLVNTKGGRTYAPEEIRSWFLKTGFKNAQRKLVTDGVLIIGKR